ncbi:hypothetical protein PMAYCL1PPCAC_31929, partial [Pristionchus mayeri]
FGHVLCVKTGSIQRRQNYRKGRSKMPIFIQILQGCTACRSPLSSHTFSHDVAILLLLLLGRVVGLLAGRGCVSPVARIVTAIRRTDVLARIVTAVRGTGRRGRRVAACRGRRVTGRRVRGVRGIRRRVVAGGRMSRRGLRIGGHGLRGVGRGSGVGGGVGRGGGGRVVRGRRNLLAESSDAEDAEMRAVGHAGQRLVEITPEVHVTRVGGGEAGLDQRDRHGGGHLRPLQRGQIEHPVVGEALHVAPVVNLSAGDENRTRDGVDGSLLSRGRHSARRVRVARVRVNLQMAVQREHVDARVVEVAVGEGREQIDGSHAEESIVEVAQLRARDREVVGGLRGTGGERVHAPHLETGVGHDDHLRRVLAHSADVVTGHVERLREQRAIVGDGQPVLPQVETGDVQLEIAVVSLALAHEHEGGAARLRRRLQREQELWLSLDSDGHLGDEASEVEVEDDQTRAALARTTGHGSLVRLGVVEEVELGGVHGLLHILEDSETPTTLLLVEMMRLLAPGDCDVFRLHLHRPGGGY